LALRAHRGPLGGRRAERRAHPDRRGLQCSFVSTGACELQSWYAIDATLEITHSANTVTGTFDAGLASSAGADAGEIHIEFDAPVCTLEGVATIVLY
jgi:hypothetical protein